MASAGGRKIAVVGPGALGSLLAAALSRKVAGSIMVLDHDSGRAALLQRHGLILEYPEGIVQAPVFAATDPATIGPVDLVLLCVKSPTVAGILPSLSPLLSANSLLLAFQNGISHLALLEKTALPGAWALAVTSLGATLLAPGRVRFGGSGQTVLGFSGKAAAAAQAKLEAAAALLNAAGLPTRIEPEIMAQVWNKLLVNAGINALTALNQCKNGELLAKEESRALLVAAVEEAARVARAKGIGIADDPVQRTIAVCRATAENISSMLQDVRKKRRTEIDAINGAVVAEADRLGLAAPVNRQLVSAIKALENSYSHLSS
ncbi:ketopantoate reductase family protein [Thiovibrio sp. JS02]